MEDQQPTAGDLTVAAPDEKAPDEATSEDAAPDTEEPTSEAEAEAEAEGEGEGEGEGEAEVNDEGEAEAGPAPRRNWLHRNKVALGVGTSAALFVAAAAFAGAAVQPYLMDRAAVATKLDIARTAADAISTLWTYTPEDMDKLPDRSAKYLSGDFEDQYRKYVDAIVPTNRQAKVTNNTQVVGTAVESLNGSEATAIVYTNTTSTSPLTKNVPAMKYLSYRLQLKRDDGDWLVTKMTTVTSLDLTPQM